MSDLFRRLGSRDAKPNPDAFWSDKWGWMDDASPADLIAEIRSRVESGTIKGEGRRMCDAHDDVEAYKNPDACRAGLNANDEAACVMVDYLVIPVSDGGSET